MSKTAMAPVREPATPARMSPTKPFAVMRSISDEMDRLFAELGKRWPFAPMGLYRGDLWSPAVEVEEREGKLFVRADLPGLTKDDVKVEVTDDALTIQGERKHNEEEKKEGYYRSERFYGSFFRSVPLPEGSKTDTVKATFKDGVLEVAIELPVQPRPAAKRVEIESAAQANAS